MKIMLLAIDVGNTSVHAGVFEGNKLVKEKRWATERITGYPDIRDWGSGDWEIRDIIICSVVPRVSRLLKKWFPRAVFVDYKNVGIKVRVKKPAEVGADRLVNALAVKELYGGPAIIVDFGTATTFDVINAKGEYMGGAIAPGILLARDTLHSRTAKLPRIAVKAPRSVIGKSTVEAMRSGLVLGYAALVEGLIKNINSALGSDVCFAESESRSSISEHRDIRHSALKVIATGGLAKLICRQTSAIDAVDPHLTLKGLRLIVNSPSH